MTESQTPTHTLAPSGETPAKVSGYIFDMDDLLIRSKSIWRDAIGSLLREYHISIEAADQLHYRGLSAADTAMLIRRQFSIDTDPATFKKAFTAKLLDAVQTHPPIPLPGAVEAIRSASEYGPVAVASGSPLEVIHHVLGQLKLIQHIKVVISSDEVDAGKPEPDVFLEAARLLKASPRSCVVFEDSLVGVQAAVKAGMQCICVPSEQKQRIASMTSQIYQSLAEITWPIATRRLCRPTP
ncbi:MAG: HAD family phosphatase [Phycisphaeraceae bacterium]|nr:HAD family phosphatase [Phycisphaeraceae bacterium]